jgi:hypothetical protein
MNERDHLQAELGELDRRLRGIAFAPRASLGPEIVGRLRRGEPGGGTAPTARPRRFFAAIAAALVLTTAGVFTLRSPASVSVDRCCYDLDGGGDADDGVVVLAERDARVHRLRIYEDLDRSGTFTEGDLVRLDRGASPAMHRAATEGLVTIEHCCLDFDGGGPADDGLVVIGVPPDRVVMAAIYERRPGTGEAAGSAGFPLR